MRSALLVMLLVGCGPSLATTTVEPNDDVAADDADLTGELKAQVPSLTVWLRPTLTPEQRDGRLVYVLRGRASQNLFDVHSYVFDDPMGACTQLTARTFEVVFDLNSELNSSAAGIRLFLSITPTGTTVKPATVSFTLQPKWLSPSGSSSAWVRSEVTPIALGDVLTYRARVRTTGGAPLTVVTADGVTLPVSRRDADEWNVDLSFEQLRAAGDEAGEQVAFKVASSTGEKVKLASLSVAVASMQITRGDVEQTWPPLQCEASVQACLDALPAGATDSEACGTYYPVTRCQLPWRGVNLFSSPDDLTALNTALATVRAALPAGKQVSFRAYGVPDVMRPSDLPKVLAGWQRQEPYGDLVDQGALTGTQLRNQLQAFGGGAQSLIAAAQQVVFQQSFVAWHYTRDGGKTLDALYFATAARLIIIETDAP